tara:strand:+ start:855 stop:1175 length:321 start_codon:yes stop_codon:yes gene_type:complete
MKKIYFLLLLSIFTLNVNSQIENNGIINFKAINIDLIKQIEINDNQANRLCKLILIKERRLQYVTDNSNSNLLIEKIKNDFLLKARDFLSEDQIKRFKEIESKFKY